MSIATLADYRSRSFAPHQRIPFTKITQAGASGRLSDLWTTTPFGGSAPTTAAVPTRSTTGAMGQNNPAANQHIVRASINGQSPSVWWLVDRLSHQGGLSGTATGAQTTNLPTAALTRYTDGVGVLMGLTIYTQIGVSATTVTCSYTNEGGTAGRTSLATDFGGTSFREASRLILMPLQEGDSGVRSVESVTLAASTGTVGNFGVTLFRPILPLVIPIANQTFEWDPLLNLGGQAPEIVDDACLCWLCLPSAASSGAAAGEVCFTED